MNRLARILAAATVALTVGACAPENAEEPAELVLTNGKIVTADDDTGSARLEIGPTSVALVGTLPQ